MQHLGWRLVVHTRYVRFLIYTDATFILIFRFSLRSEYVEEKLHYRPSYEKIFKNWTVKRQTDQEPMDKPALLNGTWGRWIVFYLGPEVQRTVPIHFFPYELNSALSVPYCDL